MMLKLALEYPEYRKSARRKSGSSRRRPPSTTARATRTCRTACRRSTTRARPGWKPRVDMEDALRRIFDAYRSQVAEARTWCSENRDQGRRRHLRGTREGVPKLRGCSAPRSRRDIPVLARAGSHRPRPAPDSAQGFSKVKRTSVAEALWRAYAAYGTLLLGPDIGRRCAGEMRVRREGFEVGVHAGTIALAGRCRPPGRRLDGREMQRAFERFEGIFREKPRTWAPPAGR